MHARRPGPGPREYRTPVSLPPSPSAGSSRSRVRDPQGDRPAESAIAAPVRRHPCPPSGPTMIRGRRAKRDPENKKSRGHQHAGLEHDRDQPGALLVLGKLAEAVALEQHPEVRLDRVDGQEHLLGDLAVGRGRRRGGTPGRGGTARSAPCAASGSAGSPPGVSIAEAVCVTLPDVSRVAIWDAPTTSRSLSRQAPAPDDARAVHERSVAREPVVDEHPPAAHLLDQRVCTRHFRIPRKRDVGSRRRGRSSRASSPVRAAAAAARRRRSATPGTGCRSARRR